MRDTSVRGATQLVDNRSVGTRQARDLLRVAFGPSVAALGIIAGFALRACAIAFGWRLPGARLGRDNEG